MSALLLLDTRRVKVCICHCEMRLHLCQSIGGNGLDSKLFLTLSKEEP